MSVEDLLKQRYKLIADYPGNDYEIGFVFDNEDSVRMQENVFKKYPHLFRKLEWWEERDEKDMPEYLNISSDIFKVKQYDKNEHTLFVYLDSVMLSFTIGNKHYPIQPATSEEYLNYIKQNQQ